MNVKSLEKKEKNLVVLTIEVGADEFEAAIQDAYRKNVGRMNVPGFRKGKAPRKIVEKMYGSGVFYQDAVNASYPQAYDAAVEQSGIEPVEKADIEIQDVGPEGYTFTAGVHVYPEIEIGQYKGLSASKPDVSVDESAIDEEIDRLLRRNASIQTAERPAKMGDTVIFDFEGFVDGVPFEGGKGERHSLELGSGRFIPGFEEELVGAAAEQKFDVSVTFPGEYHAEELAGKPAVFKCLVHEVKETILPEADDEFAKDVSEFDTLAELKASIRERLEHSREHQAEHAVEDALLDQILETITGDIPDAMINNRLESLIQDFDYRLMRQNLNLQTYMQMTGQSPDDIMGQYRPMAERQVKCALIFDKVADLEKIELAPEELEAEYVRLAAEYNMDVEKIRDAISVKSITQDLRALKASKLIVETAVITEASAKDDAKPAAKPAAKKAAAKTEAKYDAKPAAKKPAAKKAPAKADTVKADGMPSEQFDKEHPPAEKAEK